MIANFPVRMCNDQARMLLLEYLEPMAESGKVEELWQAFVRELAPYATAAAQRALRKHINEQPAEVLLHQLRRFLGDLIERLEPITLNPDITAAIGNETYRDVAEAMLQLGNWVTCLEDQHLAEAIVQPSTAVMMAKGGVP